MSTLVLKKNKEKQIKVLNIFYSMVTLSWKMQKEIRAIQKPIWKECTEKLDHNFTHF